MAMSKFYQISPLGSADKKNQAISSNFNFQINQVSPQNIDPGRNVKEPPVGVQLGVSFNEMTPEHEDFGSDFMQHWDNTPNNPIIQGFQGLFNSPAVSKYLDDPGNQTKLFDADNLVKGKAGVYRSNQDGVVPFGADIDGKPLYAVNDLRDDQSFDLGKNNLYTAGTIMQQLGVFQDEEDSDTFAKFTERAGDPAFMGAITGLSSSGQKKEAVNLIMKEFNYPDLDSLDGHEDQKRAYSTAFAAYNFVENVEKMSPAQQSLSLSTMGLMSYKFKDGKTLQDKPLITSPDGKTEFSLSDAFSLAGSGTDVFSMQKNWDQLSMVQDITYGKGTPSQLAATGKRMMLLGDPSMGGAAVKQTDAELGRLGFTSVPSAGIGAITGSGEALPPNYEVIGAGEKKGQVIAVPKGLSYSASTINGTSDIRSLNDAEGVKKASIGAFKTHSKWLPNKSANDLKGSSFAAGLGQSGVLQDPYVMSAITTAAVMGNLVNKKQQAKKQEEGSAVASATKLAALAGGGTAGAAALTGGASATAGAIASSGGISATAASLGAGGAGLGTAAVATGGALLAVGAGYLAYKYLQGGKSEEQQGRDSIRKLGTDSGLFNKDDYTVTLSDGSTADIGKDGGAEGHQFRFADKAMDDVDELHPYDVDYTNDLDFSSNMMTSALVRMMAGGKGVPIDQVAGQLGNAALGKVGFGQDMTEENFAYVRDNVKGFYFKQGIQTKEDAYALSNQMLAEGRVTESDAIAMQQGINMAFDDDGFGTAQVLMAGRWKGLETAAKMPSSPGPNYSPVGVKPTINNDFEGVEPITRPTTDNPESFPEVETYELQMNPGTYGGNKNTDAFTKSIIKFQQNQRVR